MFNEIASLAHQHESTVVEPNNNGRSVHGFAEWRKRINCREPNRCNVPMAEHGDLPKRQLIRDRNKI